MATYRCLSCGTIYVSPQQGMTVYHACPLGRVLVDEGPVVPFDNPRDENIVQERSGGPVHMKAVGRGRELVDEGDALSGITFEQLKALQQRPAIGASPLPEEDLNKGRPTAMPEVPGR